MNGSPHFNLLHINALFEKKRVRENQKLRQRMHFVYDFPLRELNAIQCFVLLQTQTHVMQNVFAFPIYSFVLNDERAYSKNLYYFFKENWENSTHHIEFCLLYGKIFLHRYILLGLLSILCFIILYNNSILFNINIYNLSYTTYILYTYKTKHAYTYNIYYLIIMIIIIYLNTLKKN